MRSSLELNAIVEMYLFMYRETHADDQILLPLSLRLSKSNIVQKLLRKVLKSTENIVSSL